LLLLQTGKKRLVVVELEREGGVNREQVFV
jgi:hypothetical protein